ESLSKIDSHRPDRYRARRDFSVRSNLLGHAKRALKQSMQNRPGRASCARGFVGLLYLAKDFRLAHDHGIDSRSDSEQMLHTFHIFVAIERRRLVVRNILVDLAREAARDFFSRDASLRRGVNFHAITRRQEQRFCATRAAQHTLRFGIARETFTRFHVRRMMTEADAKKIHG